MTMRRDNKGAARSKEMVKVDADKETVRATERENETMRGREDERARESAEKRENDGRRNGWTEKRSVKGESLPYKDNGLSPDLPLLLRALIPTILRFSRQLPLNEHHSHNSGHLSVDG